MFHISFYVPEDYLEKVKSACFQAGGGKIGNYDSCSFEVRGTGQFRPLKGSSPFIGQTNETENVSEVKVEMVCDTIHIQQVIKALKEAHPYEAPAYYVIETLNF